jgi:tetratricopeptide (TPR) repeat protein
MWHYSAFQTLLAMGRNEEALAEGRRSVDIDPTFWLGWLIVGTLHAIEGRHPEALACAEKALGGAPWSPFTMGLMAGALANVGEVEKAEPLLATLRTDTYTGPAGLVYYYLARHEAEQVLEWAQKAVEQRFTAIFVTTLRPFEPLLRQSPAWLHLLKTANLA